MLTEYSVVCDVLNVLFSYIHCYNSLSFESRSLFWVCIEIALKNRLSYATTKWMIDYERGNESIVSFTIIPFETLNIFTLKLYALNKSLNSFCITLSFIRRSTTWETTRLIAIVKYSCVYRKSCIKQELSRHRLWVTINI